MCPFGANGTAQSRFKLVALEWRNLGAVEEIPGIHSAITQKVIRRTLEAIRSARVKASCDVRDDQPDASPPEIQVVRVIPAYLTRQRAVTSTTWLRDGARTSSQIG
jgi:hypothetical protein